MGDKKGSGHHKQSDTLNVIAAVLNLITAMLLLLDRFW